MKTLSSIVFALLAAAAVAAPAVSRVQVSQNATTHGVTVSYDLSEDAIVTVAFMTNSVLCTAARTVAGDVGRLVKVTGELKKGSTTEYMTYTHRKIAWDMAQDLGLENLTNYTVTARVSAWTADEPPPYYVLDLDSSHAETRRLYYESEDQLPGGIASDEYRTTKMVFRRIPAKGKTFTMGSPDAEWNLSGYESSTIMGHEYQHKVTFTKDYYLGVFEVTQAQYRRINGSLPAQGYTGEDADLCPAANVTTWNHVRCNEGDCGSWPADGRYPQNTHFLGKLRKFAGGTEIAYPGHTSWKAVTGNGYDLPTEAQWEYACRAGTTTAFNNGRNMTDKETDSALNDIAWYKGNVGTEAHVRPVGSKSPNAWGIYDMLGNVREWIIDSMEKRTTSEDYYKADRTDPEGVSPYAGTRGYRGGSYQDGAAACRSATRWVNDWGGVSSPALGFRVAVPINEL